MKKVLAVLLLVGIIALTGCSKENPIVGKWAHGSFIYTFNADGTCQYDAAGTIMKCKYKTDGNKLSITYDGDKISFDTTFSIKGKELNVKDSFGSDTIYTKK